MAGTPAGRRTISKKKTALEAVFPLNHPIWMNHPIWIAQTRG
jgi:hypothetical protein